MKKYLLFFLVLWGTLSFAQSGEVVGTFTVESSTGSDPSPTVTGYFNSTVGFLPQSVDTGDILLVRQVFAGNNRRKLYRITGITGNSPLTLNVTLIDGTSGGPFPAGAMAIFRRTEKGALLDVPNTSQEIESYINNYNVQHFEDADVDTTINRSDSMFVVLNDGTEYYVGPSEANGISDSYQIGDSIFVVTGTDTIFTGIAYANPEIDTIFNDGSNYYMVTIEGDTIEIGAVAQVVANGVHPTNPPTYLIHIDTAGVDTIYFDNNGVWTRFNVGGTQIGAPMFSTNNNFATFTPAGVPPIGAFIVDSDKGGISRKTSVAGYTAITGSNGNNVRNGDRFVQSGDMTNWNIGLNASALLSITSTRALVANPPDIAVPTGIGGQTFQGNVRTLALTNSTGAPAYVRFGTRFREMDGSFMDSVLVVEDTEVTLIFVWDRLDSDHILRLVTPHPTTPGGTTYTFLNQVNGIDLVNTSGTVTAAPNITELTYAAVVGADSILIWDSSINAHRRTSIAEIVALASSTPVTVTDQANGLDITLTGQDITIAYDLLELSTTTPATNDVLLVYDQSLAQYRTATAGQIASLATPAPDATKVTKGGDTDGAALVIGTNDNQQLEFEVNNIRRGRINTSGTWLFDQAELTDIDIVVPDSIYALNPRFAALAADYSTYTASGTLTRRLAHYVDGTANVTMTVNSALPDRSVFFIKNQDAAFLVSVFVPGGMSLAGGNWIPPGYTAWFQRRGTVIERLDQVANEVTGRLITSTNVNGVITTPHPFGSGANVRFATIMVRNEVNPYVFTIKSWDPNQITWQCWNPTTGLAQQLTNVEFTWLIKG